MVRRYESIKAREAELMADVPGWVPGDLNAVVPGIGEPVYFNKNRFVHPSFNFIDEATQIIDAQWWRGSKMFTLNPPYHHRSDFTKEDPIGK